VLIYEGGVVAIDSIGQVRWAVEHSSLDILYEGIEEDVIRFGSEFEGEWGYRWSDGAKVA
jgi:hypothetical protein